MKLAKNINSIEVRPCNDGNSFKPCKDRTWEGELLQLKLQFTSLLEREEKLELRLGKKTWKKCVSFTIFQTVGGGPRDPGRKNQN